MTDDLNPTEEVEATADEQVESSSDTTAEEQDVGALKRALEREREERRSAKEELRRIREDEDARRELLAEWGFEIADDEAEPESEYDDFEEDESEIPLTKREFQEYQEQQSRLSMWSQWESHVTDLAKENGVTLSERDRHWLASQSQGQKQFPKGPDATEKAFKELLSEKEAERQAAIEYYKESKKAPHVSQVGKSATKVPDLDDDEQRVQWMAEQYAARSAD